ncbi:MAG: YCF48-related protein, partial [Bacteroidota bacterium]
EDGGQTWDDVPGFNPNNGVFNLRELQFIDEDTGFLCGDIGLVARTQNGGATWTVLETPTTESIQDIKFLDKQVGYVCGFGSVILSTTDGGNTWTEMTADREELFRAIDFSPSRGFITTQFGSIIILDLTTSTEDITTQIYDELSIYPNPALDQLFLDGLDHRYPILEWQITDLGGRVWQTGQPEAEQLTAPINLTRLLPGTYILSLTTEEGSVSRMFLKR